MYTGNVRWLRGEHYGDECHEESAGGRIEGAAGGTHCSVCDTDVVLVYKKFYACFFGFAPCLYTTDEYSLSSSIDRCKGREDDIGLSGSIGRPLPFPFLIKNNKQ